MFIYSFMFIKYFLVVSVEVGKKKKSYPGNTWYEVSTLNRTCAEHPQKVAEKA